MLWHGLVVGLALTISTGLHWALALHAMREGGYWVFDFWDPSTLIDGIGPLLAVVCGVMLALRGRG